MNSRIGMLADWVLNSGIQNISKDERNGGFNSWYDIENKKYSYVYSEITGYGITTLIYLYKMTGRKIFLDRAKLAFNWITKFALKDGFVQARYAEGFDNIIYSFDNGMVLFGMTNLCRVTKAESDMDFARKIADFLVSMQKNDGLFYAMYDAKKRENFNVDEKWSKVSGSYHAKLSLGLLDAYDVLGDLKYKKSALRICEESLKMQKDGRFLTFKGETNMHPHSYSAEGLLFAGIMLDKKRFIDSALDAMSWSLKNQLPSGGLPSTYPNDMNERNDVLAQTLRLSSVFLQRGEIEDKEKVEKLKNRLLESQNISGEHVGGMFYGYENGKKLNHINSWVSMFALQSLIYYDSYLKNEDIKLDLLV
jgi:hypothetical protein